MDVIDFDKMGGLVPAVVQDADGGDVLMLGFMNKEALAKTLETNLVTFWSRTRHSLWTKGETSGNVLHVIEICTDCDNDAILVKARMGGDQVCCHTGARSCFFNEIGV